MHIPFEFWFLFTAALIAGGLRAVWKMDGRPKFWRRRARFNRRRWAFRIARAWGFPPINLLKKYRLSYFWKDNFGVVSEEWKLDALIRPGFWFYLPRGRVKISKRPVARIDYCRVGDVAIIPGKPEARP